MTAASPSVAAEALRLAVGEAGAKLRRMPPGRTSSVWAAQSGAGQWVVRVPVGDRARPPRYGVESRIAALLHDLGHPVATWTLVKVGETVCSVAPLLRGSPVKYGHPFSPELARALGRLLCDLHQLDSGGFGPLIDDASRLQGSSSSVTDGVLARWRHAPIWPFDQSELSAHPVRQVAPHVAADVQRLRGEILHAAQGPVGVVHSDLHREHILRDDTGCLAAVLDFGDAFVGSPAWNFALLNWYYGAAEAARVSASYRDSVGVEVPGRLLATAVGLYKLAKTPDTPAIATRLERIVATLA